MSSEEQFSKNLVLRVLWDEVQRQGVHVQSLPEPQPLNGEKEKLLEQMAQTIQVIGEELYQKPEFNRMVDELSRLANRQHFQKFLDKVFDDIKWDAILFLICGVAKSIAKMLAELGSEILSWTLDYFIEKLTCWIGNHGGWVNIAISYYSQSYYITPSSGLLLISGLLIGGYIFWRKYRSA